MTSALQAWCLAWAGPTPWQGCRASPLPRCSTSSGSSTKWQGRAWEACRPWLAAWPHPLLQQGTPTSLEASQVTGCMDSQSQGSH